jgi:hypothetical protein
VAQCKAKSKRSKLRCLKWAVRGKVTCRMHGGTSCGPKTKEGRENSRLAALRHGKYTQKTRALHREAMALIRQSKNLLLNIQ